MEYKKLGRTGLKVSELCMGSMNFGWTAPRENCAPVMDAFVEAGGNFIDTADVYSRWAPGNSGGVAEALIGDWLKTKPRDQIVLATKVRGQMGPGPNDQGLSRKHIMAACDASLRRLQTDYIDLYQTHFWDDTPLEETLRAMDDLVKAGKVRYIGCSNLPAWHLMEALWISDRLNVARYDSLQPHYNLVHRAEFEREHQAVCLKYGIGVIPIRPSRAVAQRQISAWRGSERRHARLESASRADREELHYHRQIGRNRTGARQERCCKWRWCG